MSEALPNEVVVIAPVEGGEKKEVKFTKAEEQALEQGWVPKEDWTGEGKWRDAEAFLDRGELFGKIDSQNREIKETRKTLQALQEHYLKVQETEYKRAIADLKKQKKDALIENDVEAVLDADEKLDELRDEQIKQANASARQAQQEQASQPHPEFVAWTQKNSWYETNRSMRVFADDRGLELRGKGMSPSEVLRTVAEEVRKEFPNKFYNPKRDDPSSVEGGSGQNKSNSGKVELSELETSIMKKLVGQGVLTKDAYMADIKKQRERS